MGASNAHADLIFVGNDGNWFNPANWSGGQLPDAASDITLNDGVSVVIDPAVGVPNVMFHNLSITGSATLTTLGGSNIEYNEIHVNEGGSLIARSSRLHGDLLVLEDGGDSLTNDDYFPLSGIQLNPSTNDSRAIKITAPIGRFSAGIGGTLPASPAGLGAGFYATLHADDVELGSPLQLDFLYGFTPSVGDQFQIIDVRESLVGTFAGLPEGALVEQIGQIGLFISYKSGDGNDVTITASLIPEPAVISLIVPMALFLVRRRRQN